MQPGKVALLALVLIYISLMAWVTSISLLLGTLLGVFGYGLMQVIDPNDRDLEELGFLIMNSATAKFVIGSVIVTLYVLYYTNITAT